MWPYVSRPCVSLTLYCPAHLLVRHTPDDKPTDLLTDSMFNAPWTLHPRRSSESYLRQERGVRGGGRLWFVSDVTVLLRCGWCRVTAVAFWALTLSLSHINVFTKTVFSGPNPSTHKHSHTLCLFPQHSTSFSETSSGIGSDISLLNLHLLSLSFM